MLRAAAILGSCLAFAAPIAAPASPAVALDSAVFVERSASDAGRMLEPARNFKHGDRLVYVVSWFKVGGSGGFTVTNPLPRSVYYQGSANGDEEVSVDGGKTWGRLAALSVSDAAGPRSAQAGDVTHIRWILPVLAPGASGTLTYNALVR